MGRSTFAAGPNDSFAIDVDGKIWMIDNTGVTQITRNGYLPPMVAIAVGCMHRLAIDEAGNVWGWGSNSNYTLGISTSGLIQHPEQIPMPPGVEVVAISCGDFHSILLDSDGCIWGAGNNHTGQLGFPETNTPNHHFVKNSFLQNIQAVVSAGHFNLFLDINDKVWTCGDLMSLTIIPKVVEGVPPIKEVVAGVKFCLLLDFEGVVWVFGVNDYGQLATGSTKSIHAPYKIHEKILPVAIKTCGAGWNFTVFLAEDDTVWTCGCNTHGTLGIGSDSMTRFGMKIPIKVEGVPPFRAVSCGWNHSIFLDHDGFIWGCGEGKKIPFQTSMSVDYITKIAMPQQIKLPDANRHVKSARNVL